MLVQTDPESLESLHRVHIVLVVTWAELGMSGAEGGMVCSQGGLCWEISKTAAHSGAFNAAQINTSILPYLGALRSHTQVKAATAAALRVGPVEAAQPFLICKVIL